MNNLIFSVVGYKNGKRGKVDYFEFFNDAMRQMSYVLKDFDHVQIEDIEMGDEVLVRMENESKESKLMSLGGQYE